MAAETTTTSISIIIPTHNRAESLVRTLASISETVGRQDDVEVVVIANCCSDDSVDRVRRLGDFVLPLRVLEVDQPGLNIARNEGVKAARGEFCSFLDDDVRLCHSWLDGLRGALKTGADLVSGPVRLSYEEAPRPVWVTDRIEGALSRIDLGPGIKPVDSHMKAIGANFGFKKVVAMKVGGFVPALDRIKNQLLACGESEFLRRAMQASHRMVYSSDMAVSHIVAASRLNPDYFRRVYHGMGMSMIYLREQFGFGEFFRQSVGRFGLMVLAKSRELLYRHDPGRSLEQACQVAYNRGAIVAAWKRFRGDVPDLSPPQLGHA